MTSEDIRVQEVYDIVEERMNAHLGEGSESDSLRVIRRKDCIIMTADDGNYQITVERMPYGMSRRR